MLGNVNKVQITNKQETWYFVEYTYIYFIYFVCEMEISPRKSGKCIKQVKGKKKYTSGILLRIIEIFFYFLTLI